MKALSYKERLGRNLVALWVCLMFFTGATQAQTTEAPAVLRAKTVDGNVLMLPSEEFASGEVLSIDGVRMTIAVEGDFRVYRAIHRGKEHKLYVAREGRPRWLAFDPERGRFRDVLSSLRVELRDYGRLEEVVEAAGGLSGKAYEALGFAIVHLPPDVNPAQIASKVRSLPDVRQASIQLRGPIHVPM